MILGSGWGFEKIYRKLCISYDIYSHTNTEIHKQITQEFFLKLYDPSLKGVDPHSPFLSNDQIIRIINECIIKTNNYMLVIESN